jgi:DNA-binding MarR family transcriptional regulator
MKNISTVARCASLYRSKRLEEAGITGYQASYIPEICAEPGLTQEKLAQILYVTPSSVTRQLAMLEDNGFIIRKRSTTDRRAIEVYPTEKCEQVMPLVREVFKDWREEITSSMTEEELDTLAELMEKLSQRAKEIE